MREMCPQCPGLIEEFQKARDSDFEDKITFFKGFL
jgi:hypothetical protein